MPSFIEKVITSLQDRLITMKQDQDNLLQANEEALQEAPNLSSRELAKKYSVLITTEQEIFTSLNTKLSQYQPIAGEFPIKTNKMWSPIPNESIILNMNNLSEDGELPRYNTTISASDVLPRLGNGEYWGSRESTDHTTRALYRLSAITNKKVVDLMPLNSSIYHIAPFTSQLVEYLGEEYTSIYRSYVYQAEGGALGFGFPHSGYAFGGSRKQRKQEIFYPQILSSLEVTTKYYPEDCSSWMANIFEQQHSSTTADLLCAYRVTSGSDYFVPAGWKEGAMAQELLNKFIPVDPCKERFEPGDMYVSRTFNQDIHHETTLGVSGHVGLFFSKLDGNNYDIIEFNRDRPKNLEGFGLRTVAITGEQQKKVFGLRLKLS